MSQNNFNNTSLLIGKEIPLSNIPVGEPFLLIGISEIREFKNDAYTDKIIGYAYDCVETHNFDRIKIKINGQTTPLMSNTALQEKREQGERIFVEFDDATITAYINYSRGCIADSIKASDVHLVDLEND